MQSANFINGNMAVAARCPHAAGVEIKNKPNMGLPAMYGVHSM